MDWSYSNVPFLSILSEKGKSNFSPDPTLELLFATNARANRSKTLPHSPMEHQTTKTKSLRIRPTTVTLILSQYNNQPTIPPH
jgi:hypothetical protein